MTLDDAIKHAEEVAEEQEKAAKEWYACGYGDRIKDIVAWMEIPDYAAEERQSNE